MIKYKLKITDIIEEAKETKTYYFEKPEGFTWEAGSHTHLALLGFDEGDKPNKNLVRHMSIMNLPEENRIGITTRIPANNPSEFKYKLSKLNIGDEVVIFKIASKLALKPSNRPVIFLSMGVGIAALRPVIKSYLKDTSLVPTLTNINVDSSKEFIYKNELDSLTNEAYTNIWLDSRQAFYKKLEEVSNIENALYYIIGSYNFLKDTTAKLIAKNKIVSDVILDVRENTANEFFGIEIIE